MSSNRWSLRFPSWQFSALQNRHLLICLGEDKYLLMLPGFVLICLNSAQCHDSKLAARALLTQPKVLNLSARCDWRPDSLHIVSWTPKSFCVREPRDKCHTPRKDERRGCPRRWRGGGPWPCGNAGPLRWGAEHDWAALHRAAPPENMGLDYPGTFVPAQPYSRWDELVEKPGTETTSELSCELHITQKPQLTIHASICFNEYHFSCGSFYSAFITTLQCLSCSISTNILLAELFVST